MATDSIINAMGKLWILDSLVLAENFENFIPNYNI